MNLAALTIPQLAARLAAGTLVYRTGPFRFRLACNLKELVEPLGRLYAPYELVDEPFADFNLHLTVPWGLRRYVRPQVQFALDRHRPFEPFPRRHALAFLEWGTNWCLYSRVLHCLMLHAGAVERRGHTLLLPALPGAGKSTLCAALAHRGWRFLSDEFALIRFEDLAVLPFPRLIPLKNEAIDLMADYAPQAVMGPKLHNTRKGTVAHCCPPLESVAADRTPGTPRLIIFPRYRPGSELVLKPHPKGLAFMRLPSHSFNYDRLGKAGFATLATLVDRCDVYSLHYGGDLDRAQAALAALVDSLDGAQDRTEAAGLTAAGRCSS